ncbi:MAG: hypothetical protein JNK45_11280 [Myxococcales bacterium]|nr:hypothetical protein [Myxococcales bacterium]
MIPLSLLLAPAFGFTCEYFDSTVVPATDTNPPILATRYWIDGVEHLAIWPVDEVVDTPQEAASIAVFPAAYDVGGVKRLDLQQFVQVGCHDDDADPELGQVVSVDFFVRSATQAGGVGSTVSNGLFLLGDVTDLAGYESSCGAGFDLVGVTYTWSITAWDFANNAASGGGGTITYVVP